MHSYNIMTGNTVSFLNKPYELNYFWIKMSEDFIKRAIDKAATHNLGYVSLKGLQYKVISKVLNGHNVFTALPTGFGKNITYAYHITGFAVIMVNTTSAIYLRISYISEIRDKMT